MTTYKTASYRFRDTNKIREDSYWKTSFHILPILWPEQLDPLSSSSKPDSPKEQFIDFRTSNSCLKSYFCLTKVVLQWKWTLCSRRWLLIKRIWRKVIFFYKDMNFSPLTLSMVWVKFRLRYCNISKKLLILTHAHSQDTIFDWGRVGLANGLFPNVNVTFRSRWSHQLFALRNLRT